MNDLIVLMVNNIKIDSCLSSIEFNDMFTMYLMHKLKKRRRKGTNIKFYEIIANRNIVTCVHHFILCTEYKRKQQFQFNFFVLHFDVKYIA